jgi:hypothetical protein
MDWVLKVVLGLGGWAILTSAVAIWISRLLAERLNYKWSRDQQSEIERLRAELSRNQSIQNAAIGSFAASHSAANERRFNAIDQLWKAVIRIRANTPPIVTISDILLPNEYGELFTNPNFRAARNDVNQFTIVGAMNASTADLENCRPFLGEYLWSLFFAYRALVGRSLFLISEARDVSSYRPWYQDKGIRDLLCAVFSNEDVERLLSLRIGRFDAVRMAIEQKMLEHAQGTISGEASGDLGLAQARKIASAAATLAVPSREA